MTPAEWFKQHNISGKIDEIANNIDNYDQDMLAKTIHNDDELNELYKTDPEKAIAEASAKLDENKEDLGPRL